MNKRFHEMPTKPVAVHVRPGEEAPAGALPRPWPTDVVSTGVALLDWRMLREAIRRQPQLKSFREGRVRALRG